MNTSTLDVPPRPRKITLRPAKIMAIKRSLSDPFSRFDWQTTAICLLLATLVWAVFGQAIHFDFVNFDDPAYVYKNWAITQGLSWDGIVWLFTHSNVHTWFPLTDISHQLDWQLFGANAGGHHLTNVLLHAANTILLFLALRELTGACWRSALAAALFGIHPLRSESVAWVVERKDVLSGLFFMLTLLAWAHHAKKISAIESSKTDDTGVFSFLGFRRWNFGYFFALVFCAMGLMSKSMLVTIPVVLLLLDYWPLRRWPANEAGFSQHQLKLALDLVVEKIPFFLLSAVICVVTVLTQDKVVSVAKNLTIPWRISNALQAYADYLCHMIWPVGLVVAYSHEQAYPFIWKLALSFIILAAITTAVIAGRRRHPYLVTGWLWYLATLLPVIDAIQVSLNARADRYTYLPQIGLAMMLAWGAAEFSAHWPRQKMLLGVAATSLIAMLSVGAYFQTAHWQNSFTLWTRTLACTTENSFAHNNIGSALATQGKWEAAIRHFHQALRITPDFPEAEVNLGVALVNTGNRADALRHFQRALELDPEYADAHFNLGDALANEGKFAEAAGHFALALQYQPDYPLAEYDWGLALARDGKDDEAIGHYERALRCQLDAADGRYISGVALAAQKNWDAAIPFYEAALRLKKKFAEAHYRLGLALAAQGKPTEAAEHFHSALALATAQKNMALAEDLRIELNQLPSAASAK